MDRRMDAKRSIDRKTPAVNGFLAYSTVIKVYSPLLLNRIILHRAQQFLSSSSVSTSFSHNQKGQITPAAKKCSDHGKSTEYSS